MNAKLRRAMRDSKLWIPFSFGPFGAAGAIDSWLFKAECRLLLMGAFARYATASSSGTLMVRGGSTGTPAQGTAMLASTMSLAGSADTDVSGVMHSTVQNRIVDKNQWVSLDWGGTVTNLAGCGIHLWFAPML